MQKAEIYDDQLIVVTGAAGFIGSCVVKHLNGQGLSNLILVDEIGKTDKWKNLLGKQFIDFIAPDQLFSWLEVEGRERQIEAFVHMGACSNTLETDGNYLMQNNTRYSIRLAEYALTHGHRFVYASSAATYGDGSNGFSDDHELLDRLVPMNLYGFSKHAFDLWLKRQGVLDQVVGLKFFNVFGPNENDKGEMASLLFKMFPIALKEGVVRLFKSSDPVKFGDGEQARDFLYVKDAARIVCDFLENNLNGIFNVGRGQAVTWNHLSRALFQALDKEARIEYINMSEGLNRQYQNYTCADMTKYLKAFAKPPCEYSIEAAVADYVQNYLLKGQRW